MLPKPGCVLKVGEGRGFIIEKRRRVPPLPTLSKDIQPPRTFVQRLIITAAHCLPQLPPAHRAAYTEELTYRDLLGTIDGPTNVWAECLFVDPVSDIAVLGCPDEQELDEQADRYHALINEAPVVPIGKPSSGLGWVLSLDGHWVRMKLELLSGIFGVSLLIGPTKPGMSGSPILNDEGHAIGVVCLGGSGQADQAILTRHLPAWLLGLS